MKKAVFTQRLACKKRPKVKRLKKIFFMNYDTNYMLVYRDGR